MRTGCAAPPAEAVERLDALIEDRRRLERELSDAKRKLAMGGGGAGSATPCARSRGSSSTRRAVEGVEMKDLKSLADEAKPKVGSGVVAIAADRRGRQGEPRRRRRRRI